METTAKELEAKVNTFRAASQEYITASVTCPLCGRVYAEISLALPVASDNTAAVVRYRGIVRLELVAHLQAHID